MTNNHNKGYQPVESISLKDCLQQITNERKRQTIRVVSEGSMRRVFLDPEGIELTCIESVDMHVDKLRQRLVMTIPDRCFEVDVRQKA